MRRSVLWLCLLLLASPVWALRCNGRIVDSGDHAIKVREHCGEPFYIDRYSEWQVLGEPASLQRRIEQTVEVWFYNFGSNRFMQRLVFVDDRLRADKALGYGFNRPSKGCNVDQLPMGLSNGEVVARCGRPSSQSERYQDEISRDGQGVSRLRVRRQEDWLYAAAVSKDSRLLVFLDGQLIDTQRLDR